MRLPRVVSPQLSLSPLPTFDPSNKKKKPIRIKPLKMKNSNLRVPLLSEREDVGDLQAPKKRASRRQR